MMAASGDPKKARVDIEVGTGSLEKQNELFARLEARQSAVAEQRAASGSTGLSDAIAAFQKEYSGLREAFHAGLQSLSSLPTEELDSAFDALSAKLGEMSAAVTRAVHFLPPRDVQQCQNELQQLQRQLSEQKAKLKPKAKFTFKSRLAANKEKKEKEKEKEAKAAAEQSPKSSAEDELNALLRSKARVQLVGRSNSCHSFSSEAVGGGGVALEELRSCCLGIAGRSSNLFVREVKDCTIVMGPTSGPAHIEKAENCTFVIAAHQIRIHYAVKCDFYVHVASKVIIEHCSGLRFAPYTLRYPGLEADLKASGLLGSISDAAGGASEQGEDEDARVSRLLAPHTQWSKVEDFRWLNRHQSPNWALLPEQERKHFSLTPDGAIGPCQ